MRFILYALSVASLLAGLFAMLVAKSSVHEILASIILLMFAVFLTGGVICSHLHSNSQPGTAERRYPPADPTAVPNPYAD